jgi:hypothetical protein
VIQKLRAVTNLFEQTYKAESFYVVPEDEEGKKDLFR